ncbi:MAG: DMT family transporter [Clostridium sp.]|nr:DMT family transporter [Acetatifactor muris]MCM1526434.1 DMT family transporter [Bacteroides sp.]MCM1563203.1 DMT family transporter [Clostridium sp.]
MSTTINSLKSENPKMRKAAPLLVAAASVLWGILFVFVRRLSAAGLGAMDIVAVRAYGSVLFLFPGLLAADRKLLRVRGRDCWCFVGTGVFSIVFFSYCYFRNVEISSAAFASILMYTSPVWVTLLSVLFFRERIGGRKAAALVMALLGCVLVSGVTGGVETVSVTGIALGLGSGIGYGLYSIFGRFALDRGYHPMTVTAYTFLFACAGVLPFIRPGELAGRFAAEPMLLVPALSMALFTTALSFSLYTLGLRYMEPGRAAVLATLEPSVTTLVGTLWYGEPMSAAMFGGIVLVLAASVLIARS